MKNDNTMSKIEVQFMQEGFYVPLRQCRHLNAGLAEGSTNRRQIWVCVDCGERLAVLPREVEVSEPSELMEVAR